MVTMKNIQKLTSHRSTVPKWTCNHGLNIYLSSILLIINQLSRRVVKENKDNANFQ